MAGAIEQRGLPRRAAEAQDQPPPGQPAAQRRR